MDGGKCDSGCGEKTRFLITATRDSEPPVKGELCSNHAEAVKKQSASMFREAGGHPPELRDEMAKFLTDKDTKVQGHRVRDEGSLERSDERSTLRRPPDDDTRGL